MATYTDILTGSSSSTPGTEITGGVADDAGFKPPCRLATTQDLADTLYGLLVIDGVQTVAGDRILVRGQADATSNGIWIVQAGAWTRALDFSASTSIMRGTQVYVSDGTVYAGITFVCLTAAPSVGSTPITFQPSPGYLNSADLALLPTSDPHVLNAPWNDGGVIAISAGP